MHFVLNVISLALGCYVAAVLLAITAAGSARRLTRSAGGC